MSTKIIIHARPGKKTPKIDQIGQNEYRIDIDAPAEDNKANERLIELLAEYIKLPKALLRIQVGSKSRIKIVVIG